MKTLLAYKFALLWAGFILFATIANTSTLESLSLKSLFAFDKPIHMLLFGVQAWLLVKAQSVTSPKVLATAAIASALYGVLTELLQGWLTTSRTFDYFDMLADFTGCLLVWLWFNKQQKHA